MEIIKELKKDALKRILLQGKRQDGRHMYDYRPISIQKNAIPNAEGSALCHLGNTQVIAGVKFDVATPFSDRPTEGILSTGCELVPLASDSFEPGPPSPESIELARVVDRGIRSSGCLDLKSFFLEEGKVLALYIDLYVVDYDGNFFDAASLAAMAALTCTRMPKVEEQKIIRTESTGTLALNGKAVTCTFAKVDDHKLLDPSVDEERGMDGRLTIATTGGNVCAMQKGGWGAFTKKDILELVDISFERSKELCSLF